MLSRGGFELNEIWRKQKQSLAESFDSEARDLERESASLPSPEAFRRRSALARRRGNDQEADELELHALGLEKAALYDHHDNAKTEFTESLAKLSQALKDKVHQTAPRPLSPLTDELLADYHNKHHTVSQLQDQLTRKRLDWVQLAADVHENGGNPGLADYRPQTMSPEQHRLMLAENTARRNSASLDRSQPNVHRFRSLWWANTDRARRAAAEHRDEIAAHHPDITPTIGSMGIENENRVADIPVHLGTRDQNH